MITLIIAVNVDCEHIDYEHLWCENVDCEHVCYEHVEYEHVCCELIVNTEYLCMLCHSYTTN